jgi:hypothetical protein
MIVSRPLRRVAASVLVIVGFAAMSHVAPLAHAQDKPDNFLMRLFQPPASGAVPTPAVAAERGIGADKRAPRAIRA